MFIPSGQRRWFVAALLLAAASGLPTCLAAPAAASAAAAEADLLDQPAQLSARASRSVLLAVSRAGERLIAVGEAGILLRSDDHGVTWRQTQVPTRVALTNVYFATPSQGWAVGHGGIVLHSGDAGETWVKQLDGRQAAQLELATARADVAQHRPGADKRLRDAEQLVGEGADKPLLDVYFSDERNGLVVGAYGLIFGTGDGGQTWQSLKSRLDNPKGRHLYGIHAAGAARYIAGEQGALYRSGDGGQTFAEVKTPYVGTYFGVLGAAGGALLAYGLRGTAYRSADQGATWQKIDTGQPVTFTAGHRLADGSLLLADETGRLLHSRDGGQSFKDLPVPQPSPFTGIAQAADGSLVLSGARGMTRLAPNPPPAEPKQ